jgi:hypothetical protein
MRYCNASNSLGNGWMKSSPGMAQKISLPGLVDRYVLRAGIFGVQPKVLAPEHRDSAPLRFTSKTSDLIIVERTG